MKLIDGDTILYNLKNMGSPTGYISIDEVIKMIELTPTVEQPQGEWIYFLGCGVGRAMCSECGQLGDIKKYCGYCGAKMKLG